MPCTFHCSTGTGKPARWIASRLRELADAVAVAVRQCDDPAGLWRTRPPGAAVDGPGELGGVGEVLVEGAVGHHDRGVEAGRPRDVDHGAGRCGDAQAVDLHDLVGCERSGVHVHTLADPTAGTPVPRAVDAVERQPPGRQAQQHRGRDVGEDAVRGLALVAHRGEQGVAGLEPRRHAWGRQVGAPSEADELPGPPPPAQLVIGPPRGEQLPTYDKTGNLHARQHPRPAAPMGPNERIAHSHTNMGAHTRTAVAVPAPAFMCQRARRTSHTNPGAQTGTAVRVPAPMLVRGRAAAASTARKSSR
ncbi:hypothetical protein GCM10023320_24650 [Pseudonocardia adelaidensis]|uniref:Uncharacterized protein n=1 Tax=Pseudonocardia adelaidensis TaxID=648754 RepID=A0ABP9NH00_9PSEU